jgi:hypothetical protein
MSSIKPLPIDLRDHLSEVTGNEFKVWMAYYLRTGDYDLTSHPGNQTIEQETGICNDTVKTCKASLRAKGWLAYTGDFRRPRKGNPSHNGGGQFAVPVMAVRLPWRDDWSVVVMDASTAYNTLQTMVENFHPEGSGSNSSSSSATHTLSDSNKGSVPNPVCESKNKIEAKSKPENLKSEPKPTPYRFLYLRRAGFLARCQDSHARLAGE